MLSEQIIAANEKTILIGWGDGETERAHVVHAVFLNPDGTKRFQIHTTVQSKPTTVALNGTVAIATPNGLRSGNISGLLSPKPRLNRTARLTPTGSPASGGKPLV